MMYPDLGPIWTEQAIVSVTEYRTAWNPASSNIGNYGGGQFQLSWNSTIFANSGIPYISWDSLRAVDTTGMVVNQTPSGTSLEMEGLVTNSGSAAASFAISCEEVGSGDGCPDIALIPKRSCGSRPTRRYYV